MRVAKAGCVETAIESVATGQALRRHVPKRQNDAFTFLR